MVIPASNDHEWAREYCRLAKGPPACSQRTVARCSDMALYGRGCSGYKRCIHVYIMPVNDPARTRRFAATPDLIADSLRDEILRGVIEPGAPLRQEELAERFQVSRIPVRDALLRLESQGLVHVYSNRGAFVISLSADEVREIYDMRILLEGDLIERAVPRMTAEDWRR